VDARRVVILLHLIMVLDNFPAKHGKDRENAILEAFKDGRTVNDWSTIESEYKEHTAKFYVFDDALKIDGVRINVTADTQQQLADKMGCMLLTAKLADLIWLQAEFRLVPKPRTITSSTKAMIEHSAEIDDQLKRLSNPAGLCSTVGKHWLIDEKLKNGSNKAVNYGWHVPGTQLKGNRWKGISCGVCASLIIDPDTKQYARLIQGRSLFHSDTHSDYSQTCVLVARECIINGSKKDLQEILKDPELAYLANHTGPLDIIRQPGSPEPSSIFVVL